MLQNRLLFTVAASISWPRVPAIAIVSDTSNRPQNDTRNYLKASIFRDVLVATLRGPGGNAVAREAVPRCCQKFQSKMAKACKMTCNKRLAEPHLEVQG